MNVANTNTWERYFKFTIKTSYSKEEYIAEFKSVSSSIEKAVDDFLCEAGFCDEYELIAWSFVDVDRDLTQKINELRSKGISLYEAQMMAKYPEDYEPQGTRGDRYHREVLKKILEEGYLDIDPRPKYEDGTPAHTYSINHVVMRYDLSKGECPILTLRPIAWKSAIKEILWIYQKESNKLSDLHDLGIKYWDQWDVGNGTIGARYGETVRRHSLMKNLLDELSANPYGRRHILSLWQNDDFKESGLNPCCFLTGWNVRNTRFLKNPEGDGKEYLDCILVQRSSDYPTSVSINEMQYVALQLMLAQHLGYTPGVFTHVIENCQIYDRHIDNAKELIRRSPVECRPVFRIKEASKKKTFYEFSIDDFELVDYPLDIIKERNPQLKFDLGI